MTTTSKPLWRLIASAVGALLLLSSSNALAGWVIVRSGQSIQDAVDAASPGDWILVQPGDYAGGITVDKDGLKLVAFGWRGHPRIDGTDETVPMNGITVHADNVVIEGFEVSNFKGFLTDKYHIYAAGIFVYDSKGVVIKNNNIHDNDDGIFVTACEDAVVGGNIARRCTWGVYVLSSTSVCVNRNQVSDCALSVPGGYTSAGIACVESSGVMIKWNGTSRNENLGLEIVGSQDLVVLGNKANDNNIGLYLANSSDGTLSYNSARGNSALDLDWDSSGDFTFIGNLGENVSPDNGEWNPGSNRLNSWRFQGWLRDWSRCHFRDTSEVDD